MRMERLSPVKMKYFRSLSNKKQYERVMNGELEACGAMVGSSPCGLLLLRIADGVARVEELKVSESFRRRHIAMDLLRQIQIYFPNVYRVELVRPEEGASAFFQYLEKQEEHYQESKEIPVYLLNEQNVTGIHLPETGMPLKKASELPEILKQQFLKKSDHEWHEEGCICHEKDGQIDAGVLICKEEDGNVKLYDAFSSENSGVALLTCIRAVVEKIRNRELPALKIECSTQKAALLFERLFPGLRKNRQSKMIYWYVTKE